MAEVKRAAAAIVAVLLVLAVVAQLVLPGIAERRVRDELEAVAAVSDVEVSAFPAVKLLLGEVDSLSARLSDAEAGQGELADLIARTERIDRLRVTAGRAQVAGLELTDAVLVKDGERLHAEATITREQISRALPAGARVDRISSAGGELLVEGVFEVFGFQLAGPARVAPRDGAIVLSPESGLGALAQLTLFRDPRVQVGALSATERGDRLRAGADGRLTGG